MKHNPPRAPQKCLCPNGYRSQGTAERFGRYNTDGDKNHTHIHQSDYRKGDDHPLGQNRSRVLHFLCYACDLEQPTERNKQKPCTGHNPMYAAMGKWFKVAGVYLGRPFKNIDDKRYDYGNHENRLYPPGFLYAQEVNDKEHHAEHHGNKEHIQVEKDSREDRDRE